MRIIESRSIDNQAGLLGSRLITGTSTIEGAFQSFIVAEDTIVSKVYNSIGIDVTQKLGLTSVTLKAGAFISMAKGDYFSSIKLTSGSVVAYFVSHGGKTITADAYLNEFLARTGSSYLEAVECAKATLQGLINIGLLQKASLVMSPSMYEEDLVKSVVPQDGSGDLSFTRASDATRINSAGLVEVCPWNDLTYSEDFTNAVWTKITATVTANSTIAPNGTNTATKFESIGSGVPQLSRGITGTNTISIYAKAGNISNFRIWIGSEVIFDLSTGTVLAGLATMENVGNGWYRCIISSTTAGSVNPYFVSTASGQFVYVWGAQTNIGSTAKPYFPTTDRLNVPRLTYQNGGGGCPSLLLEKQSTNLLTYSEQFDNAAWTKGDSTISANATISPDGTQNADKLIESATNASHFTYQISSITASVLTTSVFLKKSELRYAVLAISNTINKNFAVLFDLQLGVIVTNFTSIPSYVAPTSSSIEDFGNGWYRCTVTATDSFTNASCFVALNRSGADSGFSYMGDGTSGLFLWGFQSEASSYPTSYIPTTTASATRVADACYKTGISSLIGQTSGTVFWDIEVETLSATGNENILNIDSGAFGNTIYFSKSAAGSIAAEVYVSGTLQCSFSYNLPSVGRYKIALAYASNDFAFYVNGVSRGTDSSGSIPTCSRLQMGQGALGASDGKVNQAVLFTTRLTNAELASLTTI